MLRYAAVPTGGLPVLLVLGGGFLRPVPSSGKPNAGGSASTSTQRALINKYCVACHNDKLKTAGLTLETVSVENVSQHLEVWQKVVRKVRAHCMPPRRTPSAG